MKTIENKTFDEERALYESADITVKECRFEGPRDGESALKECKNVTAIDSFFALRYPFWHDTVLTVDGCRLTETCRAALWYSEHVKIVGSELFGTKAVRECGFVEIANSKISSDEFGWFSHDMSISATAVTGEYFLLRSKNLKLGGVTLDGKYSFQYVEGAILENCTLRTKDAFWHAKNVTVRNSVVKGEYLGWYSENLTLENCKIVGTQPFCYCKGLKLINCEMEDADLAFERSEVEADVTTHVISIKNPKSGVIKVKSVGEIISGSTKTECKIITSLT